MQWIIGGVALPSNPRSVFSSFLGGNILVKPTSPSDGHLMTMNKPKVSRIIWKGLGTFPGVRPSLDSGPSQLRLCLPTQILWIGLPLGILVSLLMSVCLPSSLEILMSQNSCCQKLPHPDCICHCEWTDSVKLGILEGRPPLPASVSHLQTFLLDFFFSMLTCVLFSWRQGWSVFFPTLVRYN